MDGGNGGDLGLANFMDPAPDHDCRREGIYSAVCCVLCVNCSDMCALCTTVCSVSCTIVKYILVAVAVARQAEEVHVEGIQGCSRSQTGETLSPVLGTARESSKLR